MIFKPTLIKDVVEIQPNVFEDHRGHFFEFFHKQRFIDAGINCEFVQDNQSASLKNVLRGLHFQKPPFAQAKLCRVLKGSVIDIAVDIRKNSPTYGKHISIILDDQKKNMLFIPEGFAHGFMTLEDHTIFQYKCSNYYNKESEDCILWNDSNLNINWSVNDPIVSEKDKDGNRFADYETPFLY
jgi:dTDP-4-dehydrorhamnose 3,5-epimerase